MFPFCFEWQWELGRLIFMGLFYLAMGVVSTGVSFAITRTLLDLKKEEEEH